MLKEQLEHIEREIDQRIAAAQDRTSLDAVRVACLGRKGVLTTILKSIKTLSETERKVIGAQANRLKQSIEQRLAERLQELEQRPRTQRLPQDLTLPGVTPQRGRIHPISATIEEILYIFERMNFEVVFDREIETEFYNFTALNIPPHHPSRDAFDTFFTSHGHLLRSQTSTVQIRVMEQRKPPLRIVAPGRVYRPDAVDASHSFMFHQIEGLMVDATTTFSDLKGVVHVLLRALFGERAQIRFRPHFFPFTEPSVEVDLGCLMCQGRGCTVCSQKGWLEIMGAGCVDPAVFQAVGYDATRAQGFAFGLGVERICMLRHGINDIRLFFENDLRFLNQF